MPDLRLQVGEHAKDFLAAVGRHLAFALSEVLLKVARRGNVVVQLRVADADVVENPIARSQVVRAGEFETGRLEVLVRKKAEAAIVALAGLEHLRIRLRRRALGRGWWRRSRAFVQTPCWRARPDNKKAKNDQPPALLRHPI